MKPTKLCACKLDKCRPMPTLYLTSICFSQSSSSVILGLLYTFASLRLQGWESLVSGKGSDSLSRTGLETEGEVSLLSGVSTPP